MNCSLGFAFSLLFYRTMVFGHSYGIRTVSAERLEYSIGWEMSCKILPFGQSVTPLHCTTILYPRRYASMQILCARALWGAIDIVLRGLVRRSKKESAIALSSQYYFPGGFQNARATSEGLGLTLAGNTAGGTHEWRRRVSRLQGQSASLRGAFSGVPPSAVCQHSPSIGGQQVSAAFSYGIGSP
jgi:hypothetical protein